MPVTIHTYSLDKFHGEAEEYVEKLVESKRGIEYCARCEGAHESLDWKRITNIVMTGPEGARLSAIVAYAMCPTVNEPILVEAWEDTSE